MKEISLPKVGIHPVTDDRRTGVHESPEAQIMSMAKATAALINEKLRHACGTRVECVITGTCVAGVAEPAAYEEKFSSQDADITITATPCWCYGSKATDTDPLHPRAIWGFSGTERPEAVYLAIALAAHSQKGIPVFSAYRHGVRDTDDTSIPADVKEKLLRFTHAGLAVASTRGKNYLSLGGASVGIAGSIVDHDFFESWLGMKVQAIDMTELRRRIDHRIYDETELGMALAWADRHFRYGEDQNTEQYRHSEMQSRTVLKEGLLMAMCIRDMMQGNPKLAEKGLMKESLGYNIIAVDSQGQYHWIDQYPNGDAVETSFNSSFDWNGVCEPFVIATGNDSLNGVTMLIGHQLIGTIQVFADARTYWSLGTIERVTGQPLTGRAEYGIIHLTGSDSAALDDSCQQHDAQGNPMVKPHWETEQNEVDACLATTKWCPAIRKYFRGDDSPPRFLIEGSIPFTMSWVNITKDLGPVLQIAEGWSVALPRTTRNQLDARTSSTWPTTQFALRLIGKGPFSNVYSVMANRGTNHDVLTIGHVDADLIILAIMLCIPVYMHNMEAAKIYRPSARAAHGMDIGGRSYRACQNHGSLYKC